ncbi:transcription elongation GreA/GreB family factor [Bradyrhizobium sp. USDA 3315]
MQSIKSEQPNSASSDRSRSSGRFISWNELYSNWRGDGSHTTRQSKVCGLSRPKHILSGHHPNAKNGESTMSTTSTNTTMRSEIKPPITLTADDYKRLSLLARAAENKMPDVASVLTEELERAHVLADGHPAQTVCMGSEVRFRDDSTGTVRTATLVYPDDADISRRRISVLTPVGAALIGLSAGNSITWETRTGDLRRLTVLEVRGPQIA